MNTLKHQGTLLKLKGSKGALAAAEAHNMRRIRAEFRTYDHIDEKLSNDNIKLVPLGDDSYEQRVFNEINKAGIDMTTKHNKRKDKGLALEYLFTCTSGFKTNFFGLYKACLEWLKDTFPTCPVIHAVIHFDEGTPHLHVIIVPIIGKRLPASEMNGFKAASNKRNRDLFNKVGVHFGFTSSELLKGALKKKATDKVLAKIKDLSDEDFKERMMKSIESAIYLRPELFMTELDISINDLLKNEYLMKSYLKLM
jgi:hypothetical protein